MNNEFIINKTILEISFILKKQTLFYCITFLNWVLYSKAYIQNMNLLEHWLNSFYILTLNTINRQTNKIQTNILCNCPVNEEQQHSMFRKNRVVSNLLYYL